MNPLEPTLPGLDQGSLAERVDSLATWMNEMEARLRAAELASGDEKTARELRKALEALAKHDPKLEKRVNDHVAVLADRLETLASTISQTAAALAARDGEIAGLRRELEEAERKIESLGGETGRGVDAREIARLRAMIDAVAAQRPLRASDSRVDELGSRVRLLADRVDSMNATVAATAATLGRREGDLATLRERLDQGAAQIEDVTTELRRLNREGDLVARLDGLHAAMAVVNGGIAAREEEASALRERIDEAYSRVGTVVSELQRALAGLSTQVAALEGLPEATASLAGRTAELGGRVDAVAERLEAVVAQVASATREVEERGRALTAFHGELDAQREHVDTLVGALRAELAALPDPNQRDPELETRLDGLAADVAAVASRLEELVVEATAGAAATESRATALENALAELSTRLDSVEQARDAAAAQVQRADEMWLEERDSVRRELEQLTAAHQETAAVSGGVGADLADLRARLEVVEAGRDAAAVEIVRVSQALDEDRSTVGVRLDDLTAAVADVQDPSPQLTQLAGRLDVVEAGRDAAAVEIVRVSQALDEERGAVRTRLEELAAAVADVGGQDPAPQLAELAGRIEEIERTGAVIASELARTTAAWASEIDSLGERVAGLDARGQQDASPRLEETNRSVDALTARLELLERNRPASPSEHAALAKRIDEMASELARLIASTGTPDEGVAELRTVVDGLRQRIASGEQELAALAGVRDVGARLEELARRLETVELAGPVTIIPEVDGPPSGDGRFRLELRAIELRMEHAEAAARENREAVLTQLERLASRVEWRLQRLEAAQEEPYTEPEPTGAQVVPIRGGVD
jgi:chromosome segregation ATPase